MIFAQVLPIIQEFKDGKNKIALWQIDESIEELNEQIHIAHIQYKSVQRQIQHYSCLLALEKIFNKKVEIFYDEFRKPHLKYGKEHISLSHSQNLVAVMSNSHYGCGIDLENITDKAYKLRSKFLSPEESFYLKNFDQDQQIKLCVLIWSAKECLYKFHGRKSLRFKEHLHIKFEDKDFELTNKHFKGYVQKGTDYLSIGLKYQIIHNHFFVYTTEPFE